MKNRTYVQGGRFYERMGNGPLVPSNETDATHRVDFWACRRVADFPGERIPAGGALATCADCGVAIVYNPARQVDARKLCMQCAGILPLPFPN